MELTMFKSKLHQLRVTQANLNYEGSITIDRELLEQADLLPYEKVQVLNINNGARIETYTIPGEAGKRTCCLNGAAARLAQIDDRIIVISYARMTPEEARRHTPRVVVVDENNNPKKITPPSPPETTYAEDTGLTEQIK